MPRPGVCCQRCETVSNLPQQSHAFVACCHSTVVLPADIAVFDIVDLHLRLDFADQFRQLVRW